ncbi:NfeD family protein [Labrys monachus]|uniref:Membrane protein implicated in regulation of membrane protease activity n=1 Tax=Labrys monachus TaxID=217067 RepID=A0ABU0FNV4_9HYPH|nr:NfeD family protein [Labrys monachus]MDQ0396295.1 membrane protein implicated in regulation of membrane protease activity [Labrys monachus]
MMPDPSPVAVWGWFVVAALLMGAELAAPGAFMLWLGLAAAATGIVHLFVAMDWPYALLLFAVLGVAFAWLGRRLAARADADAADQPFLNRRAAALVGQAFTLAEPIVGGEGRIRIGDTVWHVSGADAPAGTRVRVMRIDGGRLVVE